MAAILIVDDEQSVRWAFDRLISSMGHKPTAVASAEQAFDALGRTPFDLAIVDIQLREVEKRLADRRITAEVTPAARELLSEFGWDPSFGARPLKRVIQQRLENALAQRILTGEVKEDDHVKIDAEGKSFTYTTGRA